MKTLPFEIKGYAFSIKKKSVKHIYFRVYYRERRIVVTAPFDISEDDLRNALISKKSWLERQAGKHHTRIFPETRSPEFDRFTNTDCIVHFGREYRVDRGYTMGRSTVRMACDDSVRILTRPGVNDDILPRLVDQWQREILKETIGDLVEKWSPLIGVKPPEYRIKKMKTRWGTCNTHARRIWLNALLVKLDKKFLEYVVIHEMVHLLEPSHNHRFKSFMDQFLPSWPGLEQKLNRYTL